MKAVRARRSEASPNKISFDKHSSFARSHPSFGVGIEVWTPRRELNRFYITSRERCPKHRAELGVAIVQCVSPLLQESPGLAGSVARHLLHPCLVRMPGDSGQADTATLQVNEEQDVICHQPTPGELWIPK